MAREVNEAAARLIIPEQGRFSAGSVLHELLHIRRFLVDKVPQIIVCNDYLHPKRERALTLLDNNFEHLVIVPEELCLHPERRDYWVKVMEYKLVGINPDELGTHNLEFFVYSYIFTLHVLKHDKLLQQIHGLLKSAELVDRATRICHNVLSVLTESKEVLARAYIGHFNAPKEWVCLDYFDSKNTSYKQVKLYESDNLSGSQA